MLCANARLDGPAGRRDRQPPRLSEAAAHRRHHLYRIRAQSAYFVETAERAGTAAHLSAGRFRLHGRARKPKASGIIRAGAEMVESMSCATVPKIVLTINHASGAGYYAMAGQGFDPNFTFSWPTARIGVMEGDSAVQALFPVELEKLKVQRRRDAARTEGIHRAHARRLRTLAGRPIRRRPRPRRRRDRSAQTPRRALTLALEVCMQQPRGRRWHWRPL